MLKRILANYIFKALLTSLKGKKRWLAIIVLAAAAIAQGLGLEFDGLLDAFVADVTEILNTTEG